EPCAVRRRRLERHLGKAQEAGRVGRAGEGLDERGLDQVEVVLGVVMVAGTVRFRRIEVRTLPLHHPLRRRCMVVAGAEMDPAGAAEIVVMMIVPAMHGSLLWSVSGKVVTAFQQNTRPRIQ